MRFTLTSYNILADSYIRRERYPGSPDALLRPGGRVQALLTTLMALDSDVLCLQEVEKPAFAALAVGLEPLGYAGYYAQKGNGRPDGCATFVRRPPRVLAAARVEYADESAGQARSGHVAQLLKLQLGDQTVGVVNTHLKWDPPGPTRGYGCRQTEELIGKHLAGGSAWVLCGDFNVTPDSDIVATLRAAGFRPTHEDPAPTANVGGNPKTIDYLFCNAALRAEPVAVEPFTPATPMPGPDHPSDHVPLTAAFDLR